MTTWTCVISLILLLSFIDVYQCGRFGGSRGGSRGSSSRGGSYHTSHVTYSRPSPSYSSNYRPRPSPPPRYAPARPSPPPRYTPARPSPPPRYPPANPSPPPRYAPARPSPPPVYRPASSAPKPPPYQPPSRVVTQRPLNTATSRNYQQAAGPAGRPIPHTTRRPLHVSTTRRIIPHSTARALGFGNLPPKPGSGPIGPSTYGSSYGQNPQKVKIVNKYNYHYPGYYSMPMAHYSHPGYFYTPTYHSYGIGDTGSTALGFYLGYSLSRLTTPTYSHYSFYDGYRPRYDHYEVHHYYHNKESVPPRQEIPANSIVGCVGDSSAICPANTTSLCTSNGALMCVASAISTVPCSDNRQVNCVTSTISCINNTAPECKNSNQNSTTISIPCVSKAEVQGELKTVNNTIIPVNGTIGLPAPVMTTDAPGNATTQLSVNTYQNYTESYITTTPASHSERQRRSTTQNFCVTILALPAKRQPTAGEEFLQDAKFIAEKFIENAWNL